MKRLLLSGIALTMLASCSGHKDLESNRILTQKTEIMQKVEKQKIEALLSEYKKSLNNSDAQLAQSLYTEDGIFMPTEAPSAIGAENIRKSYE
ncbi:MAG: hypothetical protein KDE33_18260, partial [Bacteroidetes bacterium]|nr:hypothetical protein [Bacteroidota bacterium]